MKEKSLTFTNKVINYIFKIIDKLISFIYKLFKNIASKFNIETYMFIALVFTLLSIISLIINMFEILNILNSSITNSKIGLFNMVFSLLFPIIAYICITKSEFVNGSRLKDKYLQIFITIFSLIFAINIVHFLNNTFWKLFFLVPNYNRILLEDASSVKMAFSTPYVLVSILLFIKLKNTLYFNLKENN